MKQIAISQKAELSLVNEAGSLPPIKDLFEESWNLFKKSLLNLFLLTIFSIAVYFGVIILLGVVFLLFGWITGLFNSLGTSGMNGLFNNGPISILVAILLGLLFIGFSIIFGSAIQIGTILIVGKPEETYKLGQVMRRSFGLVVGYLLAYMIESFFLIGGLFLFIFPVFYITFLLAFVSYEVVLNNQKAYEAIKRSAFMVRARFGDIFFRMFILILLYIIVEVFIPGIIQKIEPRTGFLLGILSFLTNSLVGWFSLCYSVCLYYQVRKSVVVDEKNSIRTIWIITILGWVIGIFFFLVGAILLVKSIQSGLMKYPSKYPPSGNYFNNPYNNNGFFNQITIPTPKGVETL